MNLTDQQKAFIDAVMTGDGHLCLRARAGTGKTATIIAATEAIVGDGLGVSVSICAFGKNIQTEIDNKLKARGINWRDANAVTTHSMGFSLVRKTWPGVRVDGGKIRALVKDEDDYIFRRRYTQIVELVHLAKLEGFGAFPELDIDDRDAWLDLAEHYGTDDEDLSRVITAAQHIYKKSAARTDVIDFDDMVLLPLLKRLPVDHRKDVIFLDEAQDTSRSRRALVKGFLKPTGRLMIVGDDRQAIMGFAGASANALDELIFEMGAQVLPLTTTWRCPKAVVALAQLIVPDFEAAADAAEGVVTQARDVPDDLRPTDAILCRNTAPLVRMAYEIIRAGTACRVEGRDIGTGLVKLLDRWKKVTGIAPFLDRLEAWADHEIARAHASGATERVAQIHDQAETLRVVCGVVIADHGDTLDDVRDFITNLFVDDVKGLGMLTLATMHRSKGREWPRVMLLDYATRCPSPYARREWQMRQEENLCYVGITRAMAELIFVETQ